MQELQLLDEQSSLDASSSAGTGEHLKLAVKPLSLIDASDVKCTTIHPCCVLKSEGILCPLVRTSVASASLTVTKS